MIPEKPSPKRYWYGPYEGYESRGQRCLQDDLGVDEASAEAILRLRRQVIELLEPAWFPVLGLCWENTMGVSNEPI